MMGLPQKHFIALAVWCALLAAIYAGIEMATGPKVATTGPTGELQIPRSADGHFHLTGRINGTAANFLVDTGASTVTVGQGLARKLGLPAGPPVTVMTANGSVTGTEVTGQTVTLGSMTIRDVRIVVLPRHEGPALLGQNVLRHLEVTQTADRMVLRSRAASG